MPDITGRLAALSPEQLQSLADQLMSQSPARQTDDITPHLPRPDFLPLSYSQEGVWVLESMGLVGSAYLESVAFRVKGTLDTHALEKALASHILRCSPGEKRRRAPREGERMSSSGPKPGKIPDTRSIPGAFARSDSAVK